MFRVGGDAVSAAGAAPELVSGKEEKERERGGKGRVLRRGKERDFNRDFSRDFTREISLERFH
jgi:hypothetical protein